MSIPTQMSLAGFIATAPDLHFTSAGAEYHQWQAAYPTLRKTGTPRRRASANASSLHSCHPSSRGRDAQT